MGEDVEKREPLCTVGGNVNWCSHCGTQNGGSSKNQELPYDVAIPLLGIYPKEMKAGFQRYLHSHVHCSIIPKRQNRETT